MLGPQALCLRAVFRNGEQGPPLKRGRRLLQPPQRGIWQCLSKLKMAFPPCLSTPHLPEGLDRWADLSSSTSDGVDTLPINGSRPHEEMVTPLHGVRVLASLPLLSLCFFLPTLQALLSPVQDPWEPCFKRSELKMSGFGIRKVLLIEKVHTEEVGDLMVPQIRLNGAQKLGFFYFKG